MLLELVGCGGRLLFMDLADFGLHLVSGFGCCCQHGHPHVPNLPRDAAGADDTCPVDHPLCGGLADSGGIPGRYFKVTLLGFAVALPHYVHCCLASEGLACWCMAALRYAGREGLSF